jgi:hypothetical protein
MAYQWRNGGNIGVIEAWQRISAIIINNGEMANKKI